MNTIWKYPLEITDINKIQMPKGAEILCIQMQDTTPCLWAKVDSAEKEMQPRIIETCGTGNRINSLVHNYIGTYQLSSSALVFHVFEDITPW